MAKKSYKRITIGTQLHLNILCVTWIEKCRPKQPSFGVTDDERAKVRLQTKLIIMTLLVPTHQLGV
jgi:hypothetical protein